VLQADVPPSAGAASPPPASVGSVASTPPSLPPPPELLLLVDPPELDELPLPEPDELPLLLPELDELVPPELDELLLLVDPPELDELLLADASGVFPLLSSPPQPARATAAATDPAATHPTTMRTELTSFAMKRAPFRLGSRLYHATSKGWSPFRSRPCMSA
jgi:hypothetical protein